MGSQGLHAVVDATVSWADPKAETVTYTYRPPVGMAFNQEKSGGAEVGPEGTRRPVFPLLGGGSGEVHGICPVLPRDASERLLGVVVRKGEALLVLGSATTP
jgi:hypothetical protein